MITWWGEYVVVFFCATKFVHSSLTVRKTNKQTVWQNKLMESKLVAYEKIEKLKFYLVVEFRLNAYNIKKRLNKDCLIAGGMYHTGK